MFPWKSWSMSPWFLLLFFLTCSLSVLWESEILWDPFLPYVILLTFRNPPRVMIFPNRLPVLNRDVVPYKCPDDSLVFGRSFFRCERLPDFVKLSDVPVCIPTSRKLWHASLGSGLAATQTIWLLDRLNLLLETPSKLIDSQLISVCGYLVTWYLSYLVILIQLEKSGRGPWYLVLTVLIVTTTVSWIMVLSRPTNISRFLLPISFWAIG